MSIQNTVISFFNGQDEGIRQICDLTIERLENILKLESGDNVIENLEDLKQELEKIQREHE